MQISQPIKNLDKDIILKKCIVEEHLVYKNEKILFIFEGKKTEPYIMQIIKELYFKDDKYIFISYCNNIQSLFNDLKMYGDLDLVGLLKENEKKHP